MEETVVPVAEIWLTENQILEIIKNIPATSQSMILEESKLQQIEEIKEMPTHSAQ